MKPTWGLLALSRAGQVGLDLDETLGSEPQQFRLNISLPSLELRFNVASPAITSTLARFLREQYGQQRFAELCIGELDGLRVVVIKDDEFADRFFIRAANRGLVDVAIADP